MMSCTRSNPPNGYTAENRTSTTLQNRTTSPALERAMVTIAHQDNVLQPTNKLSFISPLQPHHMVESSVGPAPQAANINIGYGETPPCFNPEEEDIEDHVEEFKTWLTASKVPKGDWTKALVRRLPLDGREFIKCRFDPSAALEDVLEALKLCYPRNDGRARSRGNKLKKTRRPQSTEDTGRYLMNLITAHATAGEFSPFDSSKEALWALAPKDCLLLAASWSTTRNPEEADFLQAAKFLDETNKWNKERTEAGANVSCIDEGIANALGCARMPSKLLIRGISGNEPVRLVANSCLLRSGGEIANVSFLSEQVGYSTTATCKYEPQKFDINPELSDSEKIDVLDVLYRYRELFSEEWNKAADIEPYHIKLKANTEPIRQKAYRRSPKERDIIEEQVKEMCEKGVIRKSTSPWASPVVLVKKSDGSYRFCVDYRKVNNVTEKFSYPLPDITDCLDRLAGMKYFSHTDFVSGYWQCPLDETSKPITAFTTGNGLYEFQVLPFGLTGAPGHFERIMDTLLAELKWSECMVYLDDVIVYGRDIREHNVRLTNVLECFRGAGLSLKPSKCRFAYQKLPILGHVGVAKTVHRIKQRFYWKGLEEDVRKYVRSCKVCQAFKPQRFKPAAPLEPLPPATDIWERVGIDHQGPFKKSVEGYEHILTIVDHFKPRTSLDVGLPTVDEPVKTYDEYVTNRILENERLKKIADENYRDRTMMTKCQYDLANRDRFRKFEVGDLVLLESSRRKPGKTEKFLPKYVGPSNPPNGYTAENRTSTTLQNRTTSPALERAMVTIAHQDNFNFFWRLGVYTSPLIAFLLYKRGFGALLSTPLLAKYLGTLSLLLISTLCMRGPVGYKECPISKSTRVHSELSKSKGVHSELSKSAGVHSDLSKSTRLCSRVTVSNFEPTELQTQLSNPLTRISSQPERGHVPFGRNAIKPWNRVDNLPSYPMSPEQSYTLSSASVEDFKAQSGPKSPTSPTRGSESCRCSGDYTEPQMSQNSNFSCSSIEESEDNSNTQGLLRVGGRLKYSYLNENQNFPLLQPKPPRQESLIKNLLTENADIPEAIDENQEDSSILETTFVIEDEESNKDIGTPKIEISEVSVIDNSEGKYSKEPVVSVEALDKKELCHDDSAHLNVVEADLNRPKEATSGIINVYTEANESSSKEKVVPVEIVDTSTKDYLQSGEKAKLSRWKPIDSLCLEDVKESEDDDENYSSSAYIEWPEILKKEVLRPEALEKAVNLEDFEKAAESRQLSKEHLEESTEQGSCIKAESKPWEDPIESDLAAAESDNPAVPERELANESENLIQDSPQSDTQRWKLIPLPFKQ
ncbi:hypothetical protein LAZ67_2002067 [Cordylochernes scorpioides]|uniref:Reverse transcriptase domain-containing protein n=1 Tax=Cordylochernes scorpioides TaxID=51811 RepID=A0ABY6K2P5_9ARAC|nr:hypothetical protein LAZ67_2002067 [Cordylochernes scorpioides]